jgi:signal peptidase I
VISHAAQTKVSGGRGHTAGNQMRQHTAASAETANMLVAVQSLLYIFVVAVFIITFCMQPFRIPSGSMEPTLMIGDFLLVNKQLDGAAGTSSGPLPNPQIKRGEIVVFHYPVNPAMHLVKRVVGIPGDRIRLREGRVFLNGKPLTESYAIYRPAGPDNFRDNFPRMESADPNIDSHWWIRMRKLIENNELIVPAGNYFVLGDNRNDSEDSRYWGFVPREAIVGTPFLVYFSLRQNLGDEAVAEARAQTRRAGMMDALAGFARWDRTLRIVK